MLVVKLGDKTFNIENPPVKRCIICSKDAFLVYKEYLDKYEIYSCRHCLVKFCYPREPAEYNQVHKKEYISQVEFSKAMKVNHKDPVKALLDNSWQFKAPLDYLHNKGKLNILDVGCSYGYFGHILRHLGHNYHGIDISSDAIDFAKKQFGDYYSCGDISSIKSKYDVVIAVETIEHLINPMSFIRSALDIAPNLIITTPNSDFYMQVKWAQLIKSSSALEHVPLETNIKVISEILRENMWFTDDPPVHLTLFEKQTFKTISGKVKFYEFSEHNDSIIGAIL